MYSRLGIALTIAIISALTTTATTEGVAHPFSSLYTVRVIQGQGRPSCPSGFMCLYENGNYNESGVARILIADTSVPDLGRTCNFNDVTSSIFNNSSTNVNLYEDYLYQGRTLGPINPGKYYNYAGTQFDKIVTSLQFDRRPLIESTC